MHYKCALNGSGSREFDHFSETLSNEYVKIFVAQTFRGKNIFPAFSCATNTRCILTHIKFFFFCILPFLHDQSIVSSRKCHLDDEICFVAQNLVAQAVFFYYWVHFFLMKKNKKGVHWPPKTIFFFFIL